LAEVGKGLLFPDTLRCGVTSPFAPKLWLAPLTFGGNLPFRRLCVFFGAEVTVGEMAVVRNLIKGKASERALLRSHAEEPWFGAQLADRDPATVGQGAKLAEERGARFVDLNCGCPIHAVAGRGLGAGLLRKPNRIAALVESMRQSVSIPVTVKLRTGWSADKTNVSEIARICEESGAAALTLHARSREQRYTRAADWDLIGRIASERGIPVVGNGDILTHYEARDRMARSGVTSVMLARGALIKPWLFREIREGRDLDPTAEERVELLWRFLGLLRDHFGASEGAERRARQFLTWHLGFFCRYRPLPEAQYLEASRRHPLLQTRFEDVADLDPLARLLRDGRVEVHALIVERLCTAGSSQEALETLRSLELPPDEQPARSDRRETSEALVSG
jgi:tRNA-dihydrouridine synthase 3